MIDPGTLLADRYRIKRLLGEGAMGAVYEAEHIGIGRRVCVKVLHDRFSGNEQAMARFNREVRAATATGHENIVEVFDFGIHQSVPFIVMEMLRGETLVDRMAVGPIGAATAVRIVGQMLSALASSHAAGVVHRDLKPANVFLAFRGDDHEFVKLLDFGVSKIRRTDPNERNRTREGAVIGTPAYMAPEQWMGRRDVDHRADLFSVGVILYELLTGGLPYEGETDGEIFLELVRGQGEPPPPSVIAPESPAPLDPVVLRAVRRSRDERFQTAQDFLEALRPHGAEEISAVVQLPQRVVRNELAEVSERRVRPDERTASDAQAAEHPPTSRTRGPRVFAAAGIILLVLIAGSAAALRAVSRQHAAVRTSSGTESSTRLQPVAIAPPATVVSPSTNAGTTGPLPSSPSSAPPDASAAAAPPATASRAQPARTSPSVSERAGRARPVSGGSETGTRRGGAGNGTDTGELDLSREY